MVEAQGAVLPKDSLHDRPDCVLAFGYLSRCLHLVHGLQSALNQLCGAEDQSSKGRGEGAGSCVLQITQLCLPVQSNRFPHHLLAEAVAHEEDGVLGDVGDERGAGALVEAPEAHLGVGLEAAIGEAPVQVRECLHLHFHGVEGLPGQDACCAPCGPSREVNGSLDGRVGFHILLLLCWALWRVTLWSL